MGDMPVGHRRELTKRHLVVTRLRRGEADKMTIHVVAAILAL